MFFLNELPTRDMLEAYARRFPGMDVPSVEAALGLLRSASVLLRRLEAYFASHGLSQTRFLILVLIDREPERQGLTAMDLVSRLDISKPVVSTTLKSLLREGLLVAAPHECDARSRRLQLSPAGLARLEAVLPGYYAILEAHMHRAPQGNEGSTDSAARASTSRTKPMPPPESSTQPPKDDPQLQQGASGDTAPR